MRFGRSRVFYAIGPIFSTLFFGGIATAGAADPPAIPAVYIRILDRDPFRSILAGAESPLDGASSPDPGVVEDSAPPFRLAGIVSVGSLRIAALEPVDGTDAFFLPEGAERSGWRALVVDPGSEAVDLAAPSGRVVRLTLADGIRREGPEAALRRALLDIPEPVLPPTRADVEASAPADQRELDERILENLARDAAAVIQASRPIEANGSDAETTEPATAPR